MGQVHLRIWRSRLRGKDQPAAVGREAVPGIHQRRIGAQPPRLAAPKGNDEELAVGPHQLAVVALHKDNPAPVRRDLGEVVAHPVLRSAHDGLGHPALAVIERNAVKIVLDLRLVGIVGVERPSGLPRGWGPCLGPRKHDVLPVGAPYSVRLHIAGIVGAGKWLALPGGAAVPLQDAACWIKDLKKAIVLEVGDVIAVRNIEGWAGKGADDEAAVGRDLGHEADARLTDSPVGIPLHHVLGLNGDVAVDWGDGIKSLVVGGAVDVDAHGFAVHRKGMAVGAGRHVVKNGAAFRLANVAQTPLDEMNGRGGKRLHRPVCALGGHQGHIAIEDWRSHRVARGCEIDVRGSGDDAAIAKSSDGDGGRMAGRMKLHGQVQILVDAAKSLAKDALAGKICAQDLDEKVFSSYLYTAGLPDPDLLIRTSGEMRISNFLLWQLSYAELYFTKVYWPDFNKEEFLKAIEEYQERNRRFGKVGVV